MPANPLLLALGAAGAGPAKPAAPDAYPDAYWAPRTDRQWITRYQDPGRPAFPRGRDYEAQAKVGQALVPFGQVEMLPHAKALDAYIHGSDMRHGAITASRAQGFPRIGSRAGSPGSWSAESPPSSRFSVEAMDRGYPWRLPKTTLSNDETTGFAPTEGVINIAEGYGDVVNGMVPAMRHEVDHALASRPPAEAEAAARRHTAPMPDIHKDLDGYRAEGDRRFEDLSKSFGWSRARELAPSLADVAYTAQDHLETTGKPLDYRLDFPNGKTQQAAWMARQGQRHGLFDGKTMNQLLATPSGLAYVRSLVRPASPLIRAIEGESTGRPR